MSKTKRLREFARKEEVQSGASALQHGAFSSLDGAQRYGDIGNVGEQKAPPAACHLMS
jgi:hypothetical protein